MKNGDTLVLLDGSKVFVVTAWPSSFDSDSYFGVASLGRRLVSFSGVFIRCLGRVWVQN